LNLLVRIGKLLKKIIFQAVGLKIQVQQPFGYDPPGADRLLETKKRPLGGTERPLHECLAASLLFDGDAGFGLKLTKVSGPYDRPGRPLRAIQAVPAEGIPSMIMNLIGHGWMSFAQGSPAPCRCL
jgi:hypothetical protein